MTYNVHSCVVKEIKPAKTIAWCFYCLGETESEGLCFTSCSFSPRCVEGQKVSSVWFWQFRILSFFLSHTHTTSHTHTRFSQSYRTEKKLKWLFMLQPGNPLCVLLDWKEPLICVKCEKHTAAVCWSWLNSIQPLQCSKAITAAARPQTQQRMWRLQLSICHFCCCHNIHVTWWFPPSSVGLFLIRGCSCIISWELSCFLSRFCKYQVEEKREESGWW